MGQELVAIKEQLAKQAAHAAAQEPVSTGTFLSTKGGVLALGEDAMPGNQVCVIVVDSMRENTFYKGEYDANVISSPTCFAFQRDGAGDADEMAPHPAMAEHQDYFEPQHEQCSGCPQNEWGSSDKGKGKACQNRRRLTLIPAGFFQPKKGSRDFDLELFDDAAHFVQADPVFIKLPPTSVEEWAKYVTQLSASHRLPPHGVVTRLYLEGHAKHQYHVKFEMLEVVPDDLLAVVMARHEQASHSVPAPYTPPEERDDAKPNGIRNLRRR